MRDRDVRQALLARLGAEHEGDTDTRIVQEMGVWAGSVRIDVAVINGELCGYELKSDRDTLDRLPLQADIYSRVFDKVFLVVGERHAAKARRIVPRWWGVIVARSASGGTTLADVRQPKVNPSINSYHLAQLLWKEEALNAMEERGIARGWRSKSADEIHQHLSSALPLHELSDLVRTALKSRRSWLGKTVGDQGQMATS